MEQDPEGLVRKKRRAAVVLETLGEVPPLKQVLSAVVGLYEAVAAALDGIEIEVVTEEINQGSLSSAMEEADARVARSGVAEAFVKWHWGGLMNVEAYPP